MHLYARGRRRKLEVDDNLVDLDDDLFRPSDPYSANPSDSLKTLQESLRAQTLGSTRKLFGIVITALLLIFIAISPDLVDPDKALALLDNPDSIVDDFQDAITNIVLAVVPGDDLEDATAISMSELGEVATMRVASSRLAVRVLSSLGAGVVRLGLGLIGARMSLNAERGEEEVEEEEEEPEGVRPLTATGISRLAVVTVAGGVSGSFAKAINPSISRSVGRSVGRSVNCIVVVVAER